MSTAVTLPGPTATARSRTHPQLVLDVGAVERNVRTIRRVAGTALLAVVKADGFGCGAEATARAALAAGATGLGTATLDEAVRLRRAGFAGRVLSWLHPVDADWETALRLRIDLGVSSVDHLRAVALAARRTGSTARVHLHVDTGMARDGAPVREWRRLVREAAAALDAVETVGVMGHLPCADDPGHASNADGARLFLGAVAAARAAGLRPSLRSLAATEAALRLPGTAFDLVRVGGGLHGIGPGLEAAATLTAPVVLTRSVRRGTPVGYGHDGVAEADTVLATLPVGYADGLPRGLHPDAAVQLAGRRCRVVGRVSMDQVVVDAGPHGVRPGEVATVFGPGRGGAPTTADWARWAGTVERDVLTAIGPRVERAEVRS